MTETAHAEIARLKRRLEELDKRMAAETTGNAYMNSAIRHRTRGGSSARPMEEPAAGSVPGQAGSSSTPTQTDMNTLIRQAAGRKGDPA